MKRIRNANFVTSLFGVRGAPMQYYFLLQMILFQSTKPLVWIISRIMLKGSSIYYVTTFWGIFEPPPLLDTKRHQTSDPPPPCRGIVLNLEVVTRLKISGYTLQDALRNTGYTPMYSGYTLQKEWLHAFRLFLEVGTRRVTACTLDYTPAPLVTSPDLGPSVTVKFKQIYNALQCIMTITVLK